MTADSEGRRDSLLHRLEAGPLVGLLTMASSIEWVELIARCGFDLVMIDQMFTGVDWADLAALTRAGGNAGISVFVRLQNDPWLSDVDGALTSRILRAVALGCDGVAVSIRSAAEAEMLLRASESWHRFPHLVNRGNAEDRAEIVAMPMVESVRSVNEVDRVCELPNLKVIGIAMTDAAEALGHPRDFEHPDVWAFVDHVVKVARGAGVAVWANTGGVANTWSDIGARASRLHDHGVQIVSLQTAEFLFESSVSRLVERVRSGFQA